MPNLADLYASLKTLCGEIFILRHSPRPADADWRHHRLSLDEAMAQRAKCQGAVDACLKTLDAVRGQLPAPWLGEDPQASKYIRLKRNLETVSYWLTEFQRPFRGFKMPMDSDDQDQHDDPEDVRSWNDAELEIRRLGDELRDYIDLHAASAAVAPPESPPLGTLNTSNLTQSQHAQFGCDYLDELLETLQANRWCFRDTYGMEKKISEHAHALGISAPLDRPSKPEHETAQELQIWLMMHDPLTDSRHERLIIRMIFAPPPASKGTVLKTVYHPLDEREQAEFRQFVERLKRELRRRGAASAAVAESIEQRAPGPAPTAVPPTVGVTVPDGFYSPTDIAKAMKSPDKADAIRMALKRLFDENRLPDGAWIENSNPARGQAKILFRLSVVRPLLVLCQPSTVG